MKLTKEEQQKLISINPAFVFHIDNADDEIKISALRQNGCVIIGIDNPTDEMMLAALNNNSYSFMYMHDVPKHVIEAITYKQTLGVILKDVENPSYEFVKKCVSENPQAIQFVDELTDELIKIALEQDGSTIRYIQDQTEEYQMIAVKQSTNSILHIVNPCYSVIEYISECDPESLKYVRNVPKEIQFKVVDRDPSQVANINFPIDEVLIKALDANPKIFFEVQEKCNFKVLKHLVTKYPEYILHVPQDSNVLQMIAIRQNPELINDIENPFTDAVIYAKDYIKDYKFKNIALSAQALKNILK